MGAKILIADDESDIVSMLGSFFESKGFRVLPAFNGAEALKQVEKQPDIILLDINMPGTDGLEVCKRIRDHISCPILFLTARIEDTDKVLWCHSVGIIINHFFRQPFRFLGERVIQLPHFDDLCIDAARPQMLFCAIACAKEVFAVCPQPV